MIFIIAGGIIAALTALYIFLIAPGRIPRKAAESVWTANYAHRGLHSKDRSVPENSLTAFTLAVSEGYGIELDIQLTADGKVVVFHDDTLSRVCGVDKAVKDCTYEELRTYRLHDTDEGVPLFSDVLSLVGGKVPLVIELKTSRRNKLLCEKAAELLDNYAGDFTIESFNPAIVRWFSKHRPQVVRGQLAMGLRGYKGLPFYQGVILSAMLSNFAARPHFMAYRHEDSRRLGLKLFRLLGGKLIAWTVRDTDDTAYCISFFDAVIFEYFKP